MLMSFCLNHWSVLFPLQDLMPIHCCAMQGRIDAIQALLFFDTAGSIKQSLETEDEVLEIIYIFSSRRNCRCWNLCGIQKHCRWWNLCGIHFCALVWNKSCEIIQGDSYIWNSYFEQSIVFFFNLCIHVLVQAMKFLLFSAWFALRKRCTNQRAQFQKVIELFTYF